MYALAIVFTLGERWKSAASRKGAVMTDVVLKGAFGKKPDPLPPPERHRNLFVAAFFHLIAFFVAFVVLTESPAWLGESLAAAGNAQDAGQALLMAVGLAVIAFALVRWGIRSIVGRA